MTLAGHLCLGRAGPKLQRLGISLAGMHEPELQPAAFSWPPWARQLSGVQCCVSTDMTRCTVRVWSLRSTSRSSSKAEHCLGAGTGVEQRDVAVAVDLIQRMKARELDADISLNTDQPASPRSAHSQASAVACVLGLHVWDSQPTALTCMPAASAMQQSSTCQVALCAHAPLTSATSDNAAHFGASLPSMASAQPRHGRLQAQSPRPSPGSRQLSRPELQAAGGGGAGRRGPGAGQGVPEAQGCSCQAGPRQAGQAPGRGPHGGGQPGGVCR